MHRRVLLLLAGLLLTTFIVLTSLGVGLSVALAQWHNEDKQRQKASWLPAAIVSAVVGSLLLVGALAVAVYKSVKSASDKATGLAASHVFEKLSKTFPLSVVGNASDTPLPGTPGDQLVALLRMLAQGTQPAMSDVLQVISALQSQTDKYIPADLEHHVHVASGMNEEVAAALLNTLVPTSGLPHTQSQDPSNRSGDKHDTSRALTHAKASVTLDTLPSTRTGAPTLSKHRNRSSTGGFVPAAPSARGAYATCEDQATTTVSEENGEQGHKALLGVLESLIHPETPVLRLMPSSKAASRQPSKPAAAVIIPAANTPAAPAHTPAAPAAAPATPAAAVLLPTVTVPATAPTTGAFPAVDSTVLSSTHTDARGPHDKQTKSTEGTVLSAHDIILTDGTTHTDAASPRISAAETVSTALFDHSHSHVSTLTSGGSQWPSLASLVTAAVDGRLSASTVSPSARVSRFTLSGVPEAGDGKVAAIGAAGSTQAPPADTSVLSVRTATQELCTDASVAKEPGLKLHTLSKPQLQYTVPVPATKTVETAVVTAALAPRPLAAAAAATLDVASGGLHEGDAVGQQADAGLHEGDVVGPLAFPARSLVTEVESVLLGADSLSGDFDAWHLSACSHNHPLSCLGYWCFHRSGAITDMGISPQPLIRFLRAVESGYNNNPYHNRAHAADVLQSVHALLHSGGLRGTYADSFTVVACYLAAIIHDYDHRGVTNDFLINTRHDLALTHNDRSPHENHHLSAGFFLLTQPHCNFLNHLPQAEWLRMRKLVIELVLATDMKQHFAVNGAFASLHRIATAANVKRIVDRLTTSGAFETAPTMGRSGRLKTLLSTHSSASTGPQKPSLSPQKRSEGQKLSTRLSRLTIPFLTPQQAPAKDSKPMSPGRVPHGFVLNEAERPSHTVAADRQSYMGGPDRPSRSSQAVTGTADRQSHTAGADRQSRPTSTGDRQSRATSTGDRHSGAAGRSDDPHPHQTLSPGERPSHTSSTGPTHQPRKSPSALALLGRVLRRTSSASVTQSPVYTCDNDTLASSDTHNAHGSHNEHRASGPSSGVVIYEAGEGVSGGSGGDAAPGDGDMPTRISPFESPSLRGTPKTAVSRAVKSAVAAAGAAERGTPTRQSPKVAAPAAAAGSAYARARSVMFSDVDEEMESDLEAGSKKSEAGSKKSEMGAADSEGASGSVGVSGPLPSVVSVERPLPVDESERLLALQMLMKCADLGHICTHLPTHLKWVAALEEEMFMQGDQERALGLPISPLCDRNGLGVTKSQVGFFEVVVLPLITNFCTRFPAAQPILHTAGLNYRYWREQAPPTSSRAASKAASSNGCKRSTAGQVRFSDTGRTSGPQVPPSGTSVSLPLRSGKGLATLGSSPEQGTIAAATAVPLCSGKRSSLDLVPH